MNCRSSRMFAVVAVLLPAALSTPLSAEETLSSAQSIYFPAADSDWQRIDPAAAGWDREKLEAALDYAGKQKSSGVVVLYEGRILAERYWKIDSPRLRYLGMRHGKTSQGQEIEDVASIQKSVVAVLVGIALDEGLVDLDKPASEYLGAGWSQASRETESKILLRHLLSMTSGLTDGLKFEAEPGTRWRYNTSAYAHSMLVLEKATKMNRNELTRKWLTEPLGMGDSRWVERRRAGQTAAVNSHGFATSARDLARFGLLILAGGKWNEKPIIVDGEYLQAMLRPSQQLNPSYGYLWWLNGQTRVSRGAGLQRIAGPLIPGAPDDLVAGQGALGRKVYVVPSEKLVVTRLGDSAEATFNVEFWKRLQAAAPKAR